MAPSFASLLAIFVPAFVVQADDFLPAASPLVLWAGRSAPGSVPGSVSFDWEGTSATFSVAGVGASVTLHTNVTLPVGKAARVSVFVNDIDTANLMLDSATSSYLLATALEKPVNRVMVQYTLEPGASGASRGSMELPTFEGFSVGNKGSFVKSTPLLRRIDIIGDSITAGSDYDKLQAVKGQLSLETECDPWAPITGYSQAYAWESYLCRYFQANCTTVAWSGKGLIHNSGCSPGPTMPTLCVISHHALPPACVAFTQLWFRPNTWRARRFARPINQMVPCAAGTTRRLPRLPQSCGTSPSRAAPTL